MRPQPIKVIAISTPYLHEAGKKWHDSPLGAKIDILREHITALANATKPTLEKGQRLVFILSEHCLSGLTDDDTTHALNYDEALLFLSALIELGHKHNSAIIVGGLHTVETVKLENSEERAHYSEKIDSFYAKTLEKIASITEPHSLSIYREQAQKMLERDISHIDIVRNIAFGLVPGAKVQYYSKSIPAVSDSKSKNPLQEIAITTTRADDSKYPIFRPGSLEEHFPVFHIFGHTIAPQICIEGVVLANLPDTAYAEIPTLRLITSATVELEEEKEASSSIPTIHFDRVTQLRTTLPTPSLLSLLSPTSPSHVQAINVIKRHSDGPKGPYYTDNWPGMDCDRLTHEQAILTETLNLLAHGDIEPDLAERTLNSAIMRLDHFISQFAKARELKQKKLATKILKQLLWPYFEDTYSSATSALDTQIDRLQQQANWLSTGDISNEENKKIFFSFYNLLHYVISLSHFIERTYCFINEIDHKVPANRISITVAKLFENLRQGWQYTFTQQVEKIEDIVKSSLRLKQCIQTKSLYSAFVTVLGKKQIFQHKKTIEDQHKCIIIRLRALANTNAHTAGTTVELSKDILLSYTLVLCAELHKLNTRPDDTFIIAIQNVLALTDQDENPIHNSVGKLPSLWAARRHPSHTRTRNSKRKIKPLQPSSKCKNTRVEGPATPNIT